MKCIALSRLFHHFSVITLKSICNFLFIYFFHVVRRISSPACIPISCESSVPNKASISLGEIKRPLKNCLGHALIGIDSHKLFPPWYQWFLNRFPLSLHLWFTERPIELELTIMNEALPAGIFKSADNTVTGIRQGRYYWLARWQSSVDHQILYDLGRPPSVIMWLYNWPTYHIPLLV